MKTYELTGAALDWAVAQTMGEGVYWKSQDFLDSFHPSTNWADGGPIIEREGINLKQWYGVWTAELEYLPNEAAYCRYGKATGLTPLIAAMRCYVVSKLGNEVEIPEDLT